MSGTRSGGRKAAATNKRIYGKDFYRGIGKLGGESSWGYEFGHGMVDPSVIGKKGGTVSRRTKVKPDPLKGGQK